jgi:hypothetical protein
MVCAMKVGLFVSYASCNLKLIGAFKHKRDTACRSGGRVSGMCRIRASTNGAFWASTAWTSESPVRVLTTPLKSLCVSQSDATFSNSTRVLWSKDAQATVRSEKVMGVEIVDRLLSALLHVARLFNGTVTAGNLHSGKPFHVCQATKGSWLYRLDWFLDLLRPNCGSVPSPFTTNEDPWNADLACLPRLVVRVTLTALFQHSFAASGGDFEHPSKRLLDTSAINSSAVIRFD